MRNESIRYLIVPGWQGSPEDHWQSHWQNSLPNSARVEQADWLTPRREDWVAALAEAIAADSTPVILIAHSLGCITVAHWAATAPLQMLRQVRGALFGGAGRCRASGVRSGVAQLRADSHAVVAIPESGGGLRQRCCRQRPACAGTGTPLGRRGRHPGRCRAHQCEVGAPALGAGLCLPVSPAKPHGTSPAATRLIVLFHLNAPVRRRFWAGACHEFA